MSQHFDRHIVADFPNAVKRLLKNDILMFRTASSVLHILPIAGLYTFLPKYLESQFRLPAHHANMISGNYRKRTCERALRGERGAEEESRRRGKPSKCIPPIITNDMQREDESLVSLNKPRTIMTTTTTKEMVLTDGERSRRFCRMSVVITTAKWIIRRKRENEMHLRRGCLATFFRPFVVASI